MHELSVTQSILDIALRHGEEAGASRITHLYLVLGDLSTIVDDSVQFYWDIISRGTMAEGAQLHFQRVPATLRCLGCQMTFSPDGQDFACPDCGSLQVMVVDGDQFYLDSIEVEGEG